MSKTQIEQRFKEANLTKQNNLNTQTRVFQQLAMFMDYKIRQQLRGFSLFNICGSQRSKFMVDIHFENAFNNLSLGQKVALYEKTIQIAIGIQSNEIESVVQINLDEDSQNTFSKKDAVRFRVQIEKGFHSWNHIYLTIDGFKVSSEQMQFDLRNYLIRKSKKKDKECYVLEAIHRSQPEILRFCFLTNSDYKKYLPMINDLIDRGYKEMIKRMYNIEVTENSKKKSQRRKEKPSTEGSIMDKKTQDLLKVKKIELSPLSQELQFLRTESRIVQEIIKYPQEQNLSLQLNEMVFDDNEKYRSQQTLAIQSSRQTQRYKKNVFSILFPRYDLIQLDRFEQYKVVTSNEQSCFVFQNVNNPLIFKLQTVLKIEPIITLKALTNSCLYKNWHPQIVQAQMKLEISSENCAIVYQKHKEYSQWYRQRDFLFIRHVFKIGQDYYIADKSIENINFIPFNTIHRGKINHQIFKISPSPSGTKLVIECFMQHGGLLNRSNSTQLTTRYLCGMQRLQSYFSKKQFEDKLRKAFDEGWKVKDIPNQESLYKQNDKQKFPSQIGDSIFSQQDVISKIDNQDVFFSIKDESQNNQSYDRLSVHELNEAQIKHKEQIVIPRDCQQIKLDEQGHIILPKEYLKMRHPIGIVQNTQNQRKRVINRYQHYICRDYWKHMEQGGLVLTNKTVIQAQDSVLSFIMSTLKKNLFSGKGALNISLPVTIFNNNSQLSQYAYALGNAPEFLEQAAKSTDTIQRMKMVMLLGLTHSILFVDVEKAFNPILGQTFQAFISGCPFYAEQISHHPPVSSILMYGRGYKIFGNLQATVHIHLNSADGINEGWYHVLFDDGQEICFQTPPAQFIGFAIGDRKFQFKDKGYYFDKQNNLFGEMCFQDFSGMFSSNKWKYRDQIQTQIMTVTSQFLNKFISNFPSKKISPSKKDILDRHGKMEGRWPLRVFSNGQQVYSINKNLPYEMIPYQYPLNSNTNYRQDLYYHKVQNLSMSQSQKERLELIQRADRKSRAKYNDNKH